MSRENQFDVTSFKPALWALGGQLQTLLGYGLPSSYGAGPGTPTHVEIQSGDKILVVENRPECAPAQITGAILLLHGLGGDADARYMVRLAGRFASLGWTAFRMNMRGAGEGARLASSLYNAGSSEDLPPVLQTIGRLYPDLPIVIVGISLGGNVLLKYLGEKKFDIPDSVKGAVAINPPVNLSACIEQISRPRNRVYNWRFVRLLRQQIREVKRHHPEFVEPDYPLGMSLKTFDKLVTAPLGGFSSIDDDYAQCSARQFLGNIHTPTLLLGTNDDPFIPAQNYVGLPEADKLQVVVSASGGHMGFVSDKPTYLGDRRWLDAAVHSHASSFLNLDHC
jgi:uncharacterized protein